MGGKMQRQIFFNEQRLLENRLCRGKLNTKNSCSEKRGISSYRRSSRFIGENGFRRKLCWSEIDGKDVCTRCLNEHVMFVSACDDVMGNFYCPEYFRGSWNMGETLMLRSKEMEGWPLCQQGT